MVSILKKNANELQSILGSPWLGKLRSFEYHTEIKRELMVNLSIQSINILEIIKSYNVYQ